MKIRDDHGLPRGIPPQPRPVQGTRPDPGADPSAPAPKTGDRVELSEKARALRVAHAALSQLPPVRTEKVESLKQAVQAGTYQVPAEKVAERMLGDGLFA